MCKYEMDPTSIVEDTERTLFCPQTDRRMDGRMDGQGETSIPPFNFIEVGGIKNGLQKFGEKLLECTTLLNFVTNSSKFTHLNYGIK